MKSPSLELPTSKYSVHLIIIYNLSCLYAMNSFQTTGGTQIFQGLIRTPHCTSLSSFVGGVAIDIFLLMGVVL